MIPVFEAQILCEIRNCERLHDAIKKEYTQR